MVKEFERSYFICWLLGVTYERHGTDIFNNIIIIDQILNAANQPSISEKEVKIIEDLTAEVDFYNLAAPWNRQQMRNVAQKRVKQERGCNE